jgi:ribosome-binding protein aMBF1 (putative translation factor)
MGNCDLIYGNCEICGDGFSISVGGRKDRIKAGNNLNLCKKCMQVIGGKKRSVTRVCFKTSYFNIKPSFLGTFLNIFIVKYEF